MKSILGFRYGYEGLVARFGHAPAALTPESGGAHPPRGRHGARHRRAASRIRREVVDRLEALGISVLFVDRRRRHDPRRDAARRRDRAARLAIGVIGVPKTIDNDIHFIDRSFGFETAFSAAVDVIRSAHVEAIGARNGIGLVKLMGRHSGFVACHAALASTDVDFVLIPEVPAALDGERGVLRCLERRARSQGHAVVVVAEGAAQELLRRRARARDAPTRAATRGSRTSARSCATASTRTSSGAARDVTLKYIDPSYAIRSVPASPVGQRVLLEHGAQRGPRGDGRQHRDADRPLARALRARADAARHAQSASRSTPSEICGCR